MLVDLPANWLDLIHSSFRKHMDENGVHPDHLDTGVYEAQMWSFDHVIADFVANRSPFEDERRAFWRAYLQRAEQGGTGIDEDEDAQEESGDVDAVPHPYGVCDSYEQILHRWPQLISDERPFLIMITELRKEHEPARDGWRWSKWGAYIGTQDSQAEYLAQEPVIESIQLFRVLQLHPAQKLSQLTPREAGQLLAGVSDEDAIEMLN